MTWVPPDAGPAYFAWIIKRPTEDDYQQTVLELDAEFQVLSTDPDQNYGYDPRTRPWFNPAMESDHAVATPPYVFFEGNTVAYTLSARTIDGQGVVGGRRSPWDSFRCPPHRASDPKLAGGVIRRCNGGYGGCR